MSRDRKMRLRIGKTNALIAIIYILFFVAYSEVESIYHYYPAVWVNLGRIEMVSFLVVPVMAVLYLKKEFSSDRLFTLLIAGYVLWLFLSTVLNGGEITDCLNYLLKLSCYLLLIAIVIKRSNKMFIWITLLILWAFAIINYLTIIQHPMGMYLSKMSDGSINSWNWFLGYKNSFIRYYLPATFLGCIYEKMIKNKWFTLVNYLMIAVMIHSLILVNAATSYVGIIGIAVFSIFAGLISKWGKITAAVYYVINAVTFFTLIIGNKINSWVAYFVVFVLNKNLTFSSRRNIWDLSIDTIIKHSIFGIGYRNGKDVANIIGMQHSHNMYLWQAVRGGIPYLILFAVIIYFVLQHADKAKDPTIVQISMCSFFVLMLMWQFEVFGNSIFLFSLIYLVWHVDKLIDNSVVIKPKRRKIVLFHH